MEAMVLEECSYCLDVKAGREHEDTLISFRFYFGICCWCIQLSKHKWMPVGKRVCVTQGRGQPHRMRTGQRRKMNTWELRGA